ncbi:Carboxylesterase family [Nesidiocoris tenuis]|uniref:Carboxylesterase family n=1 Tax=Nesidiocoris tenuis TaxID=355587 RepID=A0ABN7ATG5_9HEMI|nr:Carboxylesterase family [Nesidiocoris tenuis]
MTAIILVFLLSTATVIQGESLRRVKRIIGGSEAEKPPAYTGPIQSTSTTTEAPVSRPTAPGFVDKEERSAVVQGNIGDDGVNSFLGIRYAEPPVGRLRFQRPRKTKLKGQVDATRFGPPCPQWSPYRPGVIIGKEDCLFLNIFTPQYEGGPFPVLVWIHGGNFKSGSAAQYYPRDVVRKGLIVVAMNYRLGTLGYISNGRKSMPGNVGLFDIATAAKWVREYISYFGGDPNKIVLGGQGSGASSATLLALNGKSRSASQYSGLLAMSGTPVSPFTLDDNEVLTAEEVSAEDGCKVEEGREYVRCMQKLPLERILAGDVAVADKRKKKNDFPKGLANLNGPGPREEGKEDGRFLPNFIVHSPLEAIKKGLFPRKMPLMTGVTSVETGAGVKGNFLEQIKEKLLKPTFLQGDLMKKVLEVNTGLHINKQPDPKLKALFAQGDFLKLFANLVQGALSDVEAIIKHTTDAFFSLPAFVTSSLWSRKNPVFLYSFEHVPKKSPAAQLFAGVPLFSNNKKDEPKKGAEHGDDLAYLFDIRSLEGEPMNATEFNEADMAVKDHFTQAVWEFARSGKPRTKTSDDWLPFKSKSGDYLVFDERPRMAKNFRKCEMGMWSGDANILGSAECSFLKAVEIVNATIGAATSSLLATIDTIEGRLGIPALQESLNHQKAALQNYTAALNQQSAATFKNLTDSLNEKTQSGLKNLTRPLSQLGSNHNPLQPFQLPGQPLVAPTKNPNQPGFPPLVPPPPQQNQNPLLPLLTPQNQAPLLPLGPPKRPNSSLLDPLGLRDLQRKDASTTPPSETPKLDAPSTTTKKPGFLKVGGLLG